MAINKHKHAYVVQVLKIIIQQHSKQAFLVEFIDVYNSVSL